MLCYGARDPLEPFGFCPGSSFPIEEEDENDYVVYDSPPPSPKHAPHRVQSPSSISTYTPEPSSPGGVGIGYDSDEDDDVLPNFFSPWMCVYDLDAACGANVNAVLDAPPPPSHNESSSSTSYQVSRTPLHLPEMKTDWHDVLPTSAMLGNLFGKLAPGSQLPVVSEPGESSSEVPLPSSSLALHQRNEQQQQQHCTYFTDFACDHEIEAIYVPADETPAAATDNKGPRRKPPMAQASMSLTPAAAAQLKQQKVGTRHEPPQHASPRHHTVEAVTSTDTQELVLVKTPGADRTALKELPALRDAPPTKREELFVMKLQLCSVIFSFEDPTADKRGKDMKRQTLLELVDYVNTPAGQKIFTESIMGDLMAMVSANVCRALPPATDDFDPEEDEPVLEPAWPHLQVAYEFFLRFIVSSEVNAKAAKKYVDQKFCLQLVELFDSEDPRERDYLKTILHRIYGKFMSHRSFIRRAISNVFYRFVYETERHNGIGELLEILGSIINGFAIPLKKEHLQFLVRALIPLHKPRCVALYHQQLSYCIIQYVEKDADTATPILNGFFKCWPWSCSGKQVMFLNELEEILELLGADQLAQVSTMLFTNLARCLDSDHFQVVERALFLWNNEHLVNSGCLSRLNAHTVLPIIYHPLYKNSSGHWNATVEGLAQNVLKMYMEYDLALYDQCTAAYFREEEEAKKRLEALSTKWHEIEAEALTTTAAS